MYVDDAYGNYRCARKRKTRITVALAKTLGIHCFEYSTSIAHQISSAQAQSTVEDRALPRNANLTSVQARYTTVASIG